MSKVQPDDLIAHWHLIKSDPRQYMALADARLKDNPEDLSGGYFDRHQAWKALGLNDLALDDITKSIELSPDATAYWARGRLLHKMARYPEAIADFDRSEKLDPSGWPEAYGPFFRADCHARVGNEAAALADCALLADDHWTPGPSGTPGGDKQQVIEEIRRRVATARKDVD